MKKHPIKLMAFAAILFVTAIPVSANTASITSVPEEHKIDVQAKYNDTTNTESRYKVDLEWGAMQFTHVKEGTSVWNPDTHAYETTNAAEGRWVAQGNQITVTNHSDNPVKADLSFQAAAGYNTLTGNFDFSSFDLATAVETTVANAPTKTVNFTLGGTMDSSKTEFTTVGQITVSIDKKQ